jgi:hypothetical protein
MPAAMEIREGFWLGLGVAAALAVFGLLQLWLARAAHRG